MRTLLENAAGRCLPPRLFHPAFGAAAILFQPTIATLVALLALA